jgi:hypothetical protein
LKESPNVYKNACATLSNTLPAEAGGINSALVNQPVFTSAIEQFGKMEEGKIATAWAQFGATEKSINVYKNVLPWRSG